MAYSLPENVQLRGVTVKLHNLGKSIRDQERFTDGKIDELNKHY
jgi:hypothetical protein